LIISCPALEELPDALARLDKLKILHINHYNLPALPDFLGSLENLREFRFYMAHSFQGSFTSFRTFPAWIGKLKKLNILSFDCTDIQTLPGVIGELPLEELQINGGKLRRLPDSIGNLSRLKRLVIHSPLREIPETIGKLKTLEKCALDGLFNALPKSIGDLPLLKELYLESPRLTAIPETIVECRRLKYLSIESKSLVKIPGSICALTSLERLCLETRALVELPASIGNLSMLKEVHITSDALKNLPESAGSLKRLKSFMVTAPKLANLPASLECLIRKGHCYIQSLQPLPLYDNIEALREMRSKVSGHVKLWMELEQLNKKYVSVYDYVEKLSVKQIEDLIMSRERPHSDSKEDKELVKDIFLVRRNKLLNKFEWSEENTKRIVRVSDEFVSAWKRGIAEAKAAIDALYEGAKNKKKFIEDFDMELRLIPRILLPDSEDGEMEDAQYLSEKNIYGYIIEYLDPNITDELTIYINDRCYNPKTKDGSRLIRDCLDIHIPHGPDSLSWNIEGFGDVSLDGHYICYALHILYSHMSWAPQDIMRINKIDTKIEIFMRHEGRLV